jgi:hypothetical protein
MMIESMTSWVGTIYLDSLAAATMYLLRKLRKWSLTGRERGTLQNRHAL